MVIKNVKRLALTAASFAVLATAANAQTSSVMSEILYFNYDKSGQSVEVMQQLNRLRDTVLKCSGDQFIDLVGHTDTSGNAAYNLGLSQRRAATAKQLLVDMGVPADIIRTSGMGETSPFVPTGDGVKEALNRRVEATLSQDASCFAAPTETYTEYTEYVEPQEYVEPMQEYVEPVQEYIEPMQEYIEPVQQYVEPIQEVTVYNPPVTQPAPVYTPAPAPIAAPIAGPVATPNFALLAAGIGAIAAVAVIASEDDDADTLPASP